MMFNTPILFLVFNRPDTTKRVFEKIKEIKPKQLYIAADGPRFDSEKDTLQCEKTKKVILDSIDWECEVKTLFRKENLGCRTAISEAITWFFNHVEEGIILEDDCLPSTSFFPFCEKMLELYRNDNINIISGYSILNTDELGYNENHFLNTNASIWGWATWKNRWENLYAEVDTYEKRTWDKFPIKIIRKDYDQMFQANIEKKINSWAIIFAYNRLKSNRLDITPSQSLIQNIGEVGTHFKEGNQVSPFLNVTNKNIDLTGNKVKYNASLETRYYKQIELFMKANQEFFITTWINISKRIILNLLQKLGLK